MWPGSGSPPRPAVASSVPFTRPTLLLLEDLRGGGTFQGAITPSPDGTVSWDDFTDDAVPFAEYVARIVRDAESCAK